MFPSSATSDRSAGSFSTSDEKSVAWCVSHRLRVTNCVLAEVAPALPDVFTAQVHEPGQGVSLRCTATGSPLPQVSWLVDGEPLAERRDVQRGDFVQPDGAFVVSYVNISALAVTDGGDYTCVARNEVGAARHTARLSVTGPPFIRPARNLTVVAGRPLTLTCPVVGHPIDAVHVERGEYLSVFSKCPRAFSRVAEPHAALITALKDADTGTS